MDSVKLCADTPLVSVVVPFLNEERYLPECLRGLGVQTLPRDAFEVILVDNGSTDGSREAALSFPTATVVREPRRDPYLARNRGIDLAKGNFVVFLDADCRPEPDWLERLAGAMEQPGADILLGYLAFPRSASGFLRRHEEYYHCKLRYLAEQGLSRCYFGHAGNMAVRRALFDRIGLFAPMPIVGDTEIIHRALGRLPGAALRYVPQAKVTHLEIDRFHRYVRKLFECGMYSETLTSAGKYRVLPLHHRWRIFRQAVGEQRYGAIALSQALMSLAAGLISFGAGRVWESCRPKIPRSNLPASIQNASAADE